MSSTPLQQLIVARIERDGPITFAEYMRMALYEPGYGYYVTAPTKIGFEGDFFTSSDLPAFFAHCLGRQLHQMWQELGEPAPFNVLEQGAGRAMLGQEIKQWAAQELPVFHKALAYRVEDIHTGQDVMHTASDENQADRPVVLLSNELVDAFPVHIVQKHAEVLYELYVAVQDGRLYELLDEPSSPAVASYLDQYHIPWTTFADGWRAEVNLDALQWMQRSAQLLLPSGSTGSKHKKSAFFLTIDYGDKARGLYNPRRPYGTLACYFQHRLTERPLTRPGEQDITAHVNFSALIDEGRRHGLHLRTFTTQREWLEEHDIYEELEHIRARDFAVIDSERASDRGQIALLQWRNLRQRVNVLTDPSGMGNFKVLVMHG